MYMYVTRETGIESGECYDVGGEIINSLGIGIWGDNRDLTIWERHYQRL